MRGALTTTAEVVGVSLIGFAVNVTVGLVVAGVALVLAGVIEGRR